MRLRIHLAALSLALSLVGLSTPAQAQAPDPCTLYLCMASISGQGSKPANCIPSTTYWGIPVEAGGFAVYYYGVFVPPASYMVRQTYLNSCPGATNTANNSTILNAIMSQWGYEQYAQ